MDAEWREHIVDQRIDEAFADREPDLPSLQAFQRMQLIFELLLLRTVAAPEFEQMRGRFGRPDSARLPLEQHRAEFVLEQLDLPRDHGG
ncbi:hypothetical protein OKW27_001986 [Paraburkholderia sp. 35.1]